jgi:hypothetical protein
MRKASFAAFAEILNKVGLLLVDASPRLRSAPMNRLSILACVLAVAASGAAAYQYVAAQRGNSVLRELRDEHARLTAELHTVKQKAADAHQRVLQTSEQNASLKQSLDTLFPRSSAAPAPTAAPKIGPTVTSMATPDKAANRAVQTGFFRGRTFSAPFRGVASPALESTYHVLYRQLNLSPEQIAQFKAASLEAADRFEDLHRQAKHNNVRPTDPTMQPLYLEAEAKLKSKLTDVAGADALPKIQHFANTLFLRDAVVDVASELFYTPTPLTPTQADQLVEIMWKHMRDPFGHHDPLFGDATAMKADAREVLAEPQRGVWNAFIDQLAKTSFASLQAPPRIRR